MASSFGKAWSSKYVNKDKDYYTSHLMSQIGHDFHLIRVITEDYFDQNENMFRNMQFKEILISNERLRYTISKAIENIGENTNKFGELLDQIWLDKNLTIKGVTDKLANLRHKMTHEFDWVDADWYIKVLNEDLLYLYSDLIAYIANTGIYWKYLSPEMKQDFSNFSSDNYWWPLWNYKMRLFGNGYYYGVL